MKYHDKPNEQILSREMGQVKRSRRSYWTKRQGERLHYNNAKASESERVFMPCEQRTSFQSLSPSGRRRNAFAPREESTLPSFSAPFSPASSASNARATLLKAH